MLNSVAAHWLAKIPRMNLWALLKKTLKVCEQTGVVFDQSQTQLHLISQLSALVHNLQYLFDNVHRFILGIVASQHISTQFNTYVLFRTLITTVSLSLTHSHTQLTERVTQLYNVWNPIQVTNWYENVKLNSILSCKVCINLHSLEIVCWIICVYIQLPDRHMKDAMKTTRNVRCFQTFCEEDRKQTVCFQTPVHLLHWLLQYSEHYDTSNSLPVIFG